MKWRTVIGYKEPELLEIGKTTVYLRRNVKSIKDRENNNAWEYEECQMSLSDYEAYTKYTNSPEMAILIENLELQKTAISNLVIESMYQSCLLELQQKSL